MAKRFVGIYQLVTGLFGLLIVLLNYFGKNAAIMNSQTITSQVFTGVLLYGLLAWMGYGLYNEYPKARIVSIVLQGMQIPVIFSSGIMFKFTSSGFLSVGIKNGSFSFSHTLQPVDFCILSNYGSERIYMVYIIPIVFLLVLIKNK
jgi:hypothetical protein